MAKRKRKASLLDVQPSVLSPKTRNPATKTPVLSRKPKPPKEWRFSFQYWQQIEFFEIGDVSKTWFVSLLERLAQLSKEAMAPFFDGSKAGSGNGYRLHPIDWNQKNCPIKRADLSWLKKDILDNPAEFEIFQLAISTSLGRIVGYVDDEVFYIVLLDPAHNLQPSKDYGYKVDKTNPGSCQLSKTLQVNRKVSSELRKLGTQTSDLAEQLDKAEPDILTNSALLHFVTDIQRKEFEECADTNGISLVELMEYGVLHFNSEKPEPDD